MQLGRASTAAPTPEIERDLLGEGIVGRAGNWKLIDGLWTHWLFHPLLRGAPDAVVLGATRVRVVIRGHLLRLGAGRFVVSGRLARERLVVLLNHGRLVLDRRAEPANAPLTRALRSDRLAVGSRGWQHQERGVSRLLLRLLNRLIGRLEHVLLLGRRLVLAHRRVRHRVVESGLALGFEHLLATLRDLPALL